MTLRIRVAGASSSSTSSAIYYYGRFEVENPDGVLRTYMTAQVRVVLGEAKGVVTIPTAALSAADAAGKRFVEVVNADGGLDRRRRVAAEFPAGIDRRRSQRLQPTAGRFSAHLRA